MYTSVRRSFKQEDVAKSSFFRLLRVHSQIFNMQLTFLRTISVEQTCHMNNNINNNKKPAERNPLNHTTKHSMLCMLVAFRISCMGMAHASST